MSLLAISILLFLGCSYKRLLNYLKIEMFKYTLQIEKNCSEIIFVV